MMGDDTGDDRPQDENRTVFMPLPAATPPAEAKKDEPAADETPAADADQVDPVAADEADVAAVPSDAQPDELAEPAAVAEAAADDLTDGNAETAVAAESGDTSEPAPEPEPDPAPPVEADDAAHPGPQATVWAPTPGTTDAPAAPSLEAQQGSQPPAPAATVWAPPETASAPPQTAMSVPPAGTSFAPMTAPEDGRRIQIGDVLNHIFEVRRLIGRGGMGEVFEGINVNTEERVAIKVILPHLAADPAVQAMFRKEARTLTRLSHPGLVQYRVLAQEPVLGALYIVTEYIDGANLSDELGNLKPTPEQLAGLLRRCAQGLAAAHSLGAIHRDISPDNIMLDGGKIERARIIDFGIAKDLEGASGTIVGDGFAGKLNYVAPEQLGAYGREIGPWSDVYSLGLTMLAAVRGRDVDMGATLFDAVEKRRAGIDVAEAPEPLQPVLARMLLPDPAERLRSMEDVLAMLDGSGLVASTGTTDLQPAKPGMSKKMFAIAGGGAALVLAGVLALTFMGGRASQQSQTAAGASGAAAELEGPPLPPPADPVATTRKVVGEAFRDMSCSWLDLVNVEASGNKVGIELRGVSGKSAEAVDRIEKLIRKNGMEAANIDASDVSPVSANMCRPIEAFNAIRSTEAERLTVAQRSFEMDVIKDGAPQEDIGKLGAKPVFDINLGGLRDETVLVGLAEDGKMEMFVPNKDALLQGYDTKTGPDKYRFIVYTTHSGWSGILMLTGKPPFADANLDSTSKTRGIDWTDKFEAMAKQRNWHTEMVWYRTVDEQPNAR